MIYTLTLNPSLDYLMDVKYFKKGKTNRSSEELLYFGGKGINVSYLLKQLGKESVCLGFVAGFTGEELERQLKNAGLKTDFVKVLDGNTRINVKLKSDGITEINAKGPNITKVDLDQLYKKLDSVCENDTFVASGSLPQGDFENLYEEIVSRLGKKNVKVVVDTTGDNLLKVLKYRPFLIKPNKAELEEICGHSLESTEKIIDAAFSLKKLGAENVLVSLGDRGALLVDEMGKVHKAEKIEITPVNTTGAGDSMVAGFLCGVDKGYEYALHLGNVCGAATAESEILADKEKIQSLCIKSGI